ncbi:MAG TPA: glucose-1-phosphate cytidylyltransferase [Planctomycetota bacterium]|nr:glucose-1-phosphate cytidylyltransferase [Planctomycetota bacterium]
MSPTSSIPVVIFCGGMGTRLREETEYKPKPLVQIGDMPILWHIMKLYGHYGFREFVLCLGYKGNLIKEFFLNYPWMSNDVVLYLKGHRQEVRWTHPPEDWKITFADTGLTTQTGGRLAKIQKYVQSDTFCVTYGDGLSNVNLDKLLSFHRGKKKVATLTAIHPMSPFGVIEAKDGLATTFKEKPRLEGMINGGFFAFNRKIFDYLQGDEPLEERPLRMLAEEGQLAVHEHRDFWMAMDTFKDVERLNKLWNEGQRPWVVWE